MYQFWVAMGGEITAYFTETSFYTGNRDENISISEKISRNGGFSPNTAGESPSHIMEK
jgi:hypothetical protein